MTITQTASIPPGRTHRRIYGRRRRRAGLVALAVLPVAVLALKASGHPFAHRANPSRSGAAGSRFSRAGALTTRVSWPQQGQAALVIGSGRPAATPNEQPVPIASVAKVMTALLVLRDHPLSGGRADFKVTITAAEAQEAAQDASEDQSVAAVRAGERLSERQLLEALLIPSGNNIARLLARTLAGSQARFVAEMNGEARALGMTHTTYTDPSGWDPGTISTAADQLRVFREAMRLPTFRQIVSMASVTLPVAGTLRNTNPLVGDGFFGKTGSDTAAGGCLAFFTRVTVHGVRQTAAGVVLGQWAGGAVSLIAAGQAARSLVDSVGQQPVRITTPTGPVAGPPGGPLG